MASGTWVDLVVVGLPLAWGAAYARLHVVQRAADLLNIRSESLRRSRFLPIGVTCKPDISDQRNTPATAIAAEILAGGADLRYHDSNDSWKVVGAGVPRVTSHLAETEQADLTIPFQPHCDIVLDRPADQGQLLVDNRGKTAGHLRTVLL